jgi:hypothetical protein
MVSDGITPNNLYVLFMLNRKEIPKLVNLNAEMRLLKLEEFITESNTITLKGQDVLKKYEEFLKPIKEKKILPPSVDLTNLTKFREMFPKGLLPSGQAARVTIKELEKKMIWFFENYKYDWDTILKATKKYVDKYSLEGYMYMKTSGYFISKLEKGMIVSTLASYCDMILDGDEEEKNYNSQDVI